MKKKYLYIFIISVVSIISIFIYFFINSNKPFDFKELKDDFSLNDLVNNGFRDYKNFDESAIKRFNKFLENYEQNRFDEIREYKIENNRIHAITYTILDNPKLIEKCDYSRDMGKLGGSLDIIRYIEPKIVKENNTTSIFLKPVGLKGYEIYDINEDYELFYKYEVK